MIAADLYRFVNNHLFDLVASEIDRLGEVDVRLRAITQEQQRYLARADLARAIADVPGQAAVVLSHPLRSGDDDAAGSEGRLAGVLAFLTDPNVRHRYNDKFVAAELARYSRFFDDLDGRSLSNQQREACIRL